MFGVIPAYGFYIRHVKGIEMDNIAVSYLKSELRPPFLLSDVKGADFFRIKAERATDAPTFMLKDVENFSLQESHPLPDKRMERVKQEKL